MLLQVCCNLATMTHPLFEKQPVPYALSPKVSNPRSMEAALEAAVEVLSKVRAHLHAPARMYNMPAGVQHSSMQRYHKRQDLVDCQNLHLNALTGSCMLTAYCGVATSALAVFCK